MKKYKHGFLKGQDVVIKDYKNTKRVFGTNTEMREMVGGKTWKIHDVESDCIIIDHYYWHPKDISAIETGAIKLKNMKSFKFDEKLLTV